LFFIFFFFNDTATTEIYTLSLHDALPISDLSAGLRAGLVDRPGGRPPTATDRGHRPHRGHADPRAAWAAAHQQAATAVCVRRWLRLRPAVAGPGRRPGGGAGAAARRPLLLRRPATPTTGQDRPAPPPRRQVRLRRPGHLADPDRHLGLRGRLLRHGDRGGLELSASNAAPPPRPRTRRTPPNRALSQHPRSC